MRATVVIGNLALVAVLASSLALPLLSARSALVEPDNAQPHVASWVFIALASAVAAMNAHLSYFRPTLYARRHGGSLEGYKFVSGIPLVGSVFAAIGVLAAWGELFVAVIGMLILLIDTGGVLYLLVTLTRDRSFWRQRA